MNFEGIIVGAAVFLIIGICHPIVIKMEYYWGKKSWWVLGAYSCFWGILEIISQEKRVLKGWFPENPKRHEYYESRRMNS